MLDPGRLRRRADHSTVGHADGGHRAGELPASTRPTIDTAPLKERETEISRLMAELVEDRTAGLIDRASLLSGTAKLRAELA